MPPCRDICCRQLQSCCSDIDPAVSPLRRCIPAAFSRWQLQPDCPVQPSFSQLQPYCTLSPFLQPQSVSRIRRISCCRLSPAIFFRSSLRSPSDSDSCSTSAIPASKNRSSFSPVSNRSDITVCKPFWLCVCPPGFTSGTMSVCPSAFFQTLRT